MMKSVFTREHGKVTEKLELTIERKWVHIKYYKGNLEKSAFIIKNTPNAVNDYLEKFFNDYDVSEEIQKEVEELLIKEKRHLDINFQQYLNLLVTSSSAHLDVGVALAISIFLGYQLGAYIYEWQSQYPAFTMIGVVLGIIIGILVGYVMMIKNTGNDLKRTKSELTTRNEREQNTEWPTINPTLNEVREAIRIFSGDLPKGINRNILINHDNSIDFNKLAPYLKGIPNRPFYMSKETYDIFAEEDKDIPPLIDKVQRAVYAFYKKHNEYPIMLYDPYRTVNYFQLVQGNYLFEHPKVPLYVTENNGLITHMKPQKKQAWYY